MDDTSLLEGFCRHVYGETVWERRRPRRQAWERRRPRRQAILPTRVRGNLRSHCIPLFS